MKKFIFLFLISLWAINQNAVSQTSNANKTMLQQMERQAKIQRQQNQGGSIGNRVQYQNRNSYGSSSSSRSYNGSSSSSRSYRNDSQNSALDDLLNGLINGSRNQQQAQTQITRGLYVSQNANYVVNLKIAQTENGICVVSQEVQTYSGKQWFPVNKYAYKTTVEQDGELTRYYNYKVYLQGTGGLSAIYF